MEEEVKKKITRDNLRKSWRIFRFIKPYRKHFIIGMLLLIFSSAAIMTIPRLIGISVDDANKNDLALSDINRKIFFLIAIVLIQSVFSYLRVWVFSVVSEKSMTDIRNALYQKIISLPIHFFEQRRVGELTSRITTDVSVLQDTLSWTLAEFFRQVLTLIIGTIIIFVLVPKLTLVMLSTIPLLVIIAFVFGRFIRKQSKLTQDSLAQSNVIIDETLQSIHMVKAFTNEMYEALRYGKSLSEVLKFSLRAAKYRGLFISFIILSMMGGLILVLWYGLRLVNMGEIQIGELFSFVIYTAFIAGSIGGMSEMYARIQKTLGASERLLDILDEKSEVNMNSLQSQYAIRDTQVNRVSGEISLDHVSFSYPTRPDVEVLESLSLKIHAGQKIALVGPSGAGKSTVIQLLMRFYDVSGGNILIDGKDVRDYEISDLRQNFSVVPQEVILFGSTIRENISYAKPNASFEEIREAARKANALQFIESFPDKFETLVGERGIKLSGGQRQRIALARAILKDPAILILDEATSSLDAESERLVQEALDELMKNRTSIVIAHRLATIRKVDHIFVINHGKIIEQGTHEQLLKNTEGMYYNLVKLQFSLEEVFE